MIHYWSLAVEEQFYVLWPLLLGGLYLVTKRAGARRVPLVRAVIVAAGLVSAAAALLFSNDQLNRAFYGTDTRAYQLLAGAGIAISPSLIDRVSRIPRTLVARGLCAALVPALVVGSSSLVRLGPIQRGVLVTLLTGALIVVLGATCGDLARRLLSWAPLTYLGKISYGTYLWHWTVLVVLARRFELGTPATLGVTVVVATGLASLSYQILEHPIRTAAALDRFRPAVIATGLAISLLVGLAIAPRILADPAVDTARLVDGAALVGGVVPSQAEPSAAFASIPDYDACPPSGPPCSLTTGRGLTAIVVGDSHAAMLGPMLADLAKRHDVTLEAGYLSFCPWTRGLRPRFTLPACFADQARVFDEIIPDLDPDIVFLAHHPVDDVSEGIDLVDESGRRYEAGTDEQADALRQSITQVVSGLRADGRTVVMFEPIPIVAAADDTLTCLSAARSVNECRFITSAAPAGEERVMREIAANDDRVLSVDLDRLVCPYLPICDPVVGGRVVKRDANHLTITFARSLLDPIDQTLSAQGVFR